MMYAEHIIGLHAREHVLTDDPVTIAAVQDRYHAIAQSGILRPRAQEKPFGEDGSLFTLDRLAGDDQYIFLSCGPRYRDVREPDMCYGFIFDAEHLIKQHGALVGPDLLDDYEQLMSDIIERIDATLPPLPIATDEELAEALGDDADTEMLAFVRQQSTSHYHDIWRAIDMGDMAVKGAQKAVETFRREVRGIQHAQRKSGAGALTLLREGMEILVPGTLSLAHSIGRVEQGKILAYPLPA